jgi:tRNAThr (cytosine32-N3)-methyltransferase
MDDGEGGDSVEYHGCDFVYEEFVATVSDSVRKEVPSEELRVKYREDASTYWDNFHHKQKNGVAYKPRNYLVKACAYLEEILDRTRVKGEPVYITEVGCGVGSSIVPLLEGFPQVYAKAFDFSKEAVEVLCARCASDRLDCFVHDVAVVDFSPTTIRNGSQDVCLCIFVLSAIDPVHHVDTLKRLWGILQVGGALIFRGE